MCVEELSALVEACPEFKIAEFSSYLGAYLWCMRPDGGRLDDDEVDAIYRMAEAAKRLLPRLLRAQPDASQSPGDVRCYSCHGIRCPDCGGTGRISADPPAAPRPAVSLEDVRDAIIEYGRECENRAESFRCAEPNLDAVMDLIAAHIREATA